MHVLIVSSEYGPYLLGGLGVHVEQLVAGLVQEGVHVTVGLADPRCVAIITLEHGQQTWRILHQAERQADWIPQQLQANLQLAEALEQLHPHTPFDVVHSHDWLTFHAGQHVADATRIPHIATVHFLGRVREQSGMKVTPAIQQVEQHMCTRPDQIIAVSDYMRQLIYDVAPHTNASVTTIYNWIDPAYLWRDSAESVEDTRRRLAPVGEQIVLFVGRLTSQKGLEFLLESSFKVHSMCPQTRWIIAGGASPGSTIAAEYKRIMDRGGYDTHIEFVGPYQREALGRLYRAADCVVMPSVHEPFGLVAIEAMAAGKALIVSAAGGLREIVEHELDGLVVPLNHRKRPLGPDVDALAEAQVRVLTDHDLRARLGRAAQEKVDALFTRDRVVPQIVTLYQEVLSRG